MAKEKKTSRRLPVNSRWFIHIIICDADKNKNKDA